MASFALDIGYGRSICIEATSKGVGINTYTTLPSGTLVKVSAKSLNLSLHVWKKFNDNIEEIKTVFSNLTDGDRGEIKTDFTLNLGQKLYIRAVSEISCIHLRKYYFDVDDLSMKPGRPGIAFKYPEFKELLSNISAINDVTLIKTVASCCTSLEGQEECKICL